MIIWKDNLDTGMSKWSLLSETLMLLRHVPRLRVRDSPMVMWLKAMADQMYLLRSR